MNMNETDGTPQENGGSTHSADAAAHGPDSLVFKSDRPWPNGRLRVGAIIEHATSPPTIAATWWDRGRSPTPGGRGSGRFLHSAHGGGDRASGGGDGRDRGGGTRLANARLGLSARTCATAPAPLPTGTQQKPRSGCRSTRTVITRRRVTRPRAHDLRGTPDSARHDGRWHDGP